MRTARFPSRSSADPGGRRFSVIDLFSGAGGMSYGFHKHPAFRLIAAVDAELGKPSSGQGKLQCNSTYRRNIGIAPVQQDLAAVSAAQLPDLLGLAKDGKIDVLAACPPCTGFSRANPQNHLRDDKRNSLVRKSAVFAVELDAEVVVMENARELMQGNFKHHYEWFREYLEDHGYHVFGRTYMLSAFGLPQIRERAIVIAAKRHLPLYTLDSLWSGWTLSREAITVRRAFSSISISASSRDAVPGFASQMVRRRIAAIPKDGGSWMDLLKRPDSDRLLTDAMKRIVEKKRFGSYPDVYGRMSWDKPAPTIKRECSHVGNGRYVHPEENRLCSVREMAILQGFPNEFVLEGLSMSNIYRHIGDAVPPMISYQIAHLCDWMLSARKPGISELVLPGTNLRHTDFGRQGQLDLIRDAACG